MNTKKGFTLIELLVVVAIVGVLLAVIISSVTSARQKGRDTKRVADIQQINNAISLYMSDHNGIPPDLSNPACSVSFYDASCFAATGTGMVNWNALALQLQPYLKTLPTDPCPTCTAQALFSRVALAASPSQYVYQAPAAVNAYIQNNPGTIKTESYSVYASYLETKGKSFGFGVIVPIEEPEEEIPLPPCPYTNEENGKEICQNWDQCQLGYSKSCAWIEEYENTNLCPYTKEENGKEICEYWSACKAGGEDACKWMEEHGYKM